MHPTTQPSPQTLEVFPEANRVTHDQHVRGNKQSQPPSAFLRPYADWVTTSVDVVHEAPSDDRGTPEMQRLTEAMLRATTRGSRRTFAAKSKKILGCGLPHSSRSQHESVSEVQENNILTRLHSIEAKLEHANQQAVRQHQESMTAHQHSHSVQEANLEVSMVTQQTMLSVSLEVLGGSTYGRMLETSNTGWAPAIQYQLQQEQDPRNLQVATQQQSVGASIYGQLYGKATAPPPQGGIQLLPPGPGGAANASAPIPLGSPGACTPGASATLTTGAMPTTAGLSAQQIGSGQNVPTTAGQGTAAGQARQALAQPPAMSNPQQVSSAARVDAAVTMPCPPIIQAPVSTPMGMPPIGHAPAMPYGMPMAQQDPTWPGAHSQWEQGTGDYYRIASVPTSYEGATGNWLMIRNNTVEEIRQELRNIIRDGEPEVAGEVAERLCRVLEAPRPSSLVDQTYRNLARPAV